MSTVQPMTPLSLPPISAPVEPKVSDTDAVATSNLPSKRMTIAEAYAATVGKRDPVFDQRYKQAGEKYKPIPNPITDVARGVVNAPFDLAKGVAELGVGTYNIFQEPEDRKTVWSWAPMEEPQTGIGKTANFITQFLMPAGVASKGMKAAGVFQKGVGAGTPLLTKVANASARGVIEGAVADLVIDHESDKRVSESLLNSMANDPDAARKIAAMTAPTYLGDKLEATLRDVPLNAGGEAAFAVAGRWLRLRKLSKMNADGGWDLLVNPEKATEGFTKQAAESAAKAAKAKTKPPLLVPDWLRPSAAQVTEYVGKFGPPVDANSVPVYAHIRSAATKSKVDLAQYADLEADMLMEANIHFNDASTGVVTSANIPNSLTQYKQKYPGVDVDGLWGNLMNSLKKPIKQERERLVALENVVKNVQSPSTPKTPTPVPTPTPTP